MEERVVAIRQFGATADELLQAPHLAGAEGCLQVGHAVVQAERDLLVVPGSFALPAHPGGVAGDPVRPGEFHRMRQRRVIGQCRAALRGRDDLHRMKAENRDVGAAAAPDAAIPVGCADRVRCILDDPEPVAVREPADRGDVRGKSGEVHRHHHLRQCSVALRSLELRRQRRGIQVEGLRIDVDEVHFRAAQPAAVGARDEGVRRRPEPIPGPEPERKACDVECAGGAVHRHGMRRARCVSERLLESRNRGPLGEEVAPEDLEHRGLVGSIDPLAAVRDHPGVPSSAWVPTPGTNDGSTWFRIIARICAASRYSPLCSLS